MHRVAHDYREDYELPLLSPGCSVEPFEGEYLFMDMLPTSHISITLRESELTYSQGMEDARVSRQDVARQRQGGGTMGEGKGHSSQRLRVRGGPAFRLGKCMAVYALV